MNFDNYVKYMTQKYSLAVALAVMKTKRSDIHIEKHLNNIKNKIKKSKMDSNDDICEEDFQFDDSECANSELKNESNDSITILKDFDLNNLERLDEVNMENGSNSFLGVFETIKNIDRSSNIMNTPTTFFPGSQCSQNTTFLNIMNDDMTFCESENETEFNNKIKESEHNDLLNNDSQQTELYTLTDVNTHISQSQDNLIVSKKYLIAKANENQNEKILNSKEKQIEFTKKVVNKENVKSNKGKDTTKFPISLDYREEIESSKRNGSEDSIFKAKRLKTNNGDNKIDALKKSQESYILLDTDSSKREISQNISSLDELEYFSTQSSHNSNVKFLNKEINMKNLNEMNEITSHINEKECISNDSYNSDDLTESQAEIVTFKVLEELTKVKNYIKRERNADSDSGYKSSQTRCSYKSALSGTCWNESAHCLLNFLNSCPLVVSVVDLTEEISKVLGKLIDKLHEEEKYPKFLDKILENVENFINNVYTCGRGDDNSLLEIDEKINRIFLLNRSPHIIKFSIEKITNILENILPEFQNIIEITQTGQTENLCHIFHILEILLKRHSSYEKMLSQVSSQETLSQETVLKKSSLTEIWRKKWNLSKSEVFEVQSSEKKCIMTKCRDILNKITVEAMECYSLVSFSALQCYNILQK